MATGSAGEDARRRRRGAAATPQPLPPAVQPVPGTDAARPTTKSRSKAGTARPHVLLDPDPATRPRERKPIGLVPGMSPDEHADRIAAVLLRGSGPILLCVPGTIGGAFDSTMYAAARAFVKQANGPVSVSSIPYPNGIFDAATRFLGLSRKPADNVLALVLRRLIAANTGRPILLAGESQGSWLIADTLKAEPQLAAAVTRVAFVSKPAFVPMPAAVGSARQGASMLPGTVAGHTGVVEWRHTDDIVPSLFHRLGPKVAGGYVESLSGWLATGRFRYAPHHYEPHGDDIAAWLLRAERPDVTVHDSHDHARTAGGTDST
jgi:hypothetical protein